MSPVERFMFQLENHSRAFILFLAVCVLSILFDGSENPGFGWFLAHRNNFVNVYLVKWGWGWTFYPVGLFLFSACYIREGRFRATAAIKILAKLAAGTAVWYLWVEMIFPYIENKSGVCRASAFPDKRSCSSAGYWWTGFDSSGHCFLLLWNTLFIREEVKQFTSIKQYRDSRDSRTTRGSNKIQSKGDDFPASVGNVQKISERVDKWFYLLEFQFIFISLLTLVWELMLLSTAVHFHTIGEKVVGCLCALFSWFIFYRLLGLGPGEEQEFFHSERINKNK